MLVVEIHGSNPTEILGPFVYFLLCGDCSIKVFQQSWLINNDLAPRPHLLTICLLNHDDTPIIIGLAVFIMLAQ